MKWPTAVILLCFVVVAGWSVVSLQRAVLELSDRVAGLDLVVTMLREELDGDTPIEPPEPEGDPDQLIRCRAELALERRDAFDAVRGAIVATARACQSEIERCGCSCSIRRELLRGGS